MSQSGITDPTLQAQWSEWYVEHLRIMLTVDGIDSAERFQTSSPGWPPSLAMYTIHSAAVFQDPYYLKIRGMGPWASLIDKQFYQRNLFDAVNSINAVNKILIAPKISPGSVLAVTDQAHPALEIDGINFLWLASVGLDKTTPYRGIAVLDSIQAAGLTSHPELALYK